ncbi:MAG: hypothetical protein U5L74_02580 [Ideonella sp.]|nr:hypothetical protein [Ideonella sp.]
MRARAMIGADGARSAVAQQAIPGLEKVACVFAYHEIMRARRPHAARLRRQPLRRDLPRHHLARFLRLGVPARQDAVDRHRQRRQGLQPAQARSATACSRPAWRHARTIRREGAPLPMKPLKRWDNGRDVVVVGDAAGVIAPSSGEGIYYAMASGRHAATAVGALLATGKRHALGQARKRFMREHGRVFWVLGIMQRFWYVSDKRRERFVSICKDKDVQQLTFDAYMNKRPGAQEADGPRAHLLQGHGPPAGPGTGVRTR